MQKPFPGFPGLPGFPELPDSPSRAMPAQAWMQSAQMWAAAWQTLPLSAAQFMTRRVHRNLEFGGRLLLCKNIQEVAALQQEWFSELYTDYLEETRRMAAGALGASARGAGTGPFAEMPSPVAETTRPVQPEMASPAPEAPTAKTPDPEPVLPEAKPKRHAAEPEPRPNKARSDKKRQSAVLKAKKEKPKKKKR